jgi:hypothetical protein
MKKILKKLFFGSGTNVRPIRFGIASGLKMKISLDHKLQRYLGLDEREIHSSFEKFARRSNVFVDIGASDGYYGLVYRKLNSEGIVYSCDANPSYAEEQRSNFMLNGFPLNRIRIISKFITDHTDNESITLDDLIEEDHGSIFIKTDVDGGELLVLKGIESTLKQKDCNIIVETHSLELEEKCTAYLQDMGYKTQVIPNAWWRLFVPEQRPIAHNRWFRAEKAGKAINPGND